MPLGWNEDDTPRCFLDILFFLPDLSEGCIVVRTDQVSSLFLHCVPDLKFKSGKKKKSYFLISGLFVHEAFSAFDFLSCWECDFTWLIWSIKYFLWYSGRKRGISEYEKSYLNTFNKNGIFVEKDRWKFVSISCFKKIICIVMSLNINRIVFLSEWCDIQDAEVRARMISKLYVCISIFEIQTTQLSFRMGNRRNNCKTSFDFYFRKMLLDLFSRI